MEDRIKTQVIDNILASVNTVMNAGALNDVQTAELMKIRDNVNILAVEKTYRVILNGEEVNAHPLTLERADRLADKLIEDGFINVHVEEL